jgi:hypothetical protein
MTKDRRMTNDEIRMPKQARMTNDDPLPATPNLGRSALPASSFELRH